MAGGCYVLVHHVFDGGETELRAELGLAQGGLLNEDLELGEGGTFEWVELKHMGQ